MTDHIGNELNVGDKVLVKVPDSTKTYREATVIGLNEENKRVQIEYPEDYFYCDIDWYYQKPNKPIKFSKKLVKRWRDYFHIIKMNPEYIV